MSVGLDGLPSRTVCWDILVGVELMLWARLISWAAAGEVVRLIYGEKRIRTFWLHDDIHQFSLNDASNTHNPEFVQLPALNASKLISVTAKEKDRTASPQSWWRCTPLPESILC